MADFDEYGFPIQGSQTVSAKLPKPRKATPAEEREAAGMAAAAKNPTQLRAPPPRSLWRTFVDSIPEMFNESGGGVNAIINRMTQAQKEEDALRRFGASHNIPAEQIDQDVKSNQAQDAMDVRDTREVHAMRNEDEARRGGNHVGRFVARTLGGVVGDINPTYAIPALGATVPERIAGQAAISGADNMLGQAAEIHEGIRDKGDPYETAASMAGGAVFQAPFEVGGHIAGKISGGKLVREGAAHPDFERLNNIIVGDLEGGGSIAHPRVSPKGARGPQQVMPDTARDPGFGIRKSNGTPEDDARLGRQYTAAMLGKYGEPDLALAAYNWGPGNLDKAIAKHGENWFDHAPRETQEYVVKGMTKLLGKGSTGGPVSPMAPHDMAAAMGDPEAAGHYDLDNDPNVEDFSTDRGEDDHLDMSNDFFANEINRRMKENPDYALTSAESSRIRDMINEDPANMLHFPDLTFEGPDKSTIKFNAKKGDFDYDTSARELPENVTDLGQVRDAKQGKEFDSLIADNLGMAYRIHKGIDKGMITQDHVSNIEDSRNRAQQILRDYNDELTEPQRDSITEELDLLDHALERLRLDGSHDPVAPNDKVFPATSDYIKGETRLKRELPKPGNINTPRGRGETVQGKKSFKQLMKDLYEDESGTVGRRDYEDDTGATGGPDGQEPEHPVIGKLREALNAAKPIRKAQERLYTQARKERLSQVGQAAKATKGEAGFYTELSKLKGEMPTKDFEAIRQHFSQDEVDQLFDIVKNHPRLTLFDKINGRTALGKLLEGKVPTESELKLLNGVFPRDVIDSLMKKHQTFGNYVANALNIPRSVMASFDLSAPFRQGIALIGRKEFWKAFASMYKAWGSEKAFQAIQDEIAARPTYSLMKQAGLSLTDADRFLSEREEAFMSDWAEKVPVLGSGKIGKTELKYTPSIRASNRAYIGFLNKVRADTFDSIVHLSKEAGVNFGDNPKALKDIARFVNAATGRGDLGKLNQAAPLLSAMLFSPRLMASRIQMLNPAFYVGLSPVVRKEAIKSLLTFGTLATTILGLAAAGGASVETDSRSADFGKIRTGNTRRDILGGFQPYLVLASRLIQGETKNSNTGEVKDLTEGKFGQPNRADVVERFFRGKESPVASFVHDWLAGKDITGKKFKLSDEVINHFIPLVTQDIQDAVKDGERKGLLVDIPLAVHGMGLQTYTVNPKPEKTGFEHKSSVDEFGFSKKGSAKVDEYGFSK